VALKLLTRSNWRRDVGEITGDGWEGWDGQPQQVAWMTTETTERARLLLTVVPDLDQAAAADLWARASTASVFNHPAWWAAALAAFGAGRRLSVLRVTTGEPGRLVGLWPLWQKRLGPKEAFAAILEPVGARVTDYVMPLIDAAADRAAVLQTLLAGVDQLLGGGTLFLWPKAPEGLAPRDAMAHGCGALGLLAFTRDRPCPVMELPDNYAVLQQRWTKSHRGDVRRQVKRLGDKGASSLFVATTRSEILSRLPHLYTMHTKNWGTRTGYSEFERGPMATFVAQLAADMPMELLHYSELRLNEQALSCHFGFKDRAALLWYKPTYEIAWANYAPGKLHIARAAEWGIANGCDRIDFLQGTEPYKLQWANSCSDTTTWALARRAAYPIWWWNTTIRNLAIEYRV
jgi:CelD/BcsL family acetyltransferase involved in cellulose biosynthesis